MRRKILTYSIIIIFISCAATGAFAYSVAKNNYYSQAISNLNVISNLYEYQMESGQTPVEAASIFDNNSNVRITIVDKTGNVIHDTSSEEASLSNHMQRPEIKSAFETGYGESIRYSESENKKYVYIAKKYNVAGEDTVIRFSVATSSLLGLDSATIINILLGITVAFLVTLFFSLKYSRKITDPIKRINNYASEVSLRLETIINSMSGALVALDSDNKIILANHAAIELFGMKNYFGKYYTEFIKNKELKDFIEFFNNNAENGNMLKEIKLWDSYYLLRKTPIKSQTGYSGTVFIMVDIGEIHRLEHIRSEFVANVTHELKTPLTSIKGFVETLKNTPPEDQESLTRFLDIIDIETDRLTNLITDVLALSQIENTPSDYGIEECNLNDLLESVVNMIQPLAESKKVNIISNIDQDSVYCRANADRIKQLLINLISNAVEYNNYGGWVRVSISRQENNIIFKVEDSGIGIAREHQSRIFERFYTVNKGRSKKNCGTGLGLSIVKHIALLYHGSVSVSSELGKGSIFTVTMPISN